ncbi:MAG: HAD hydrolase-like protein, partial [Burkholderiaceae bacterium]|nr:HAD hydrolase-like protein [Burkholderiaceae bacterium]
AVMIGDNLSTDVEGARALGIDAIHLTGAHRARTTPSPRASPRALAIR